jgi:hypothetical protein
VGDTKISALTAVSSVAGANELAVNEAGTSKKASVTQLATFIDASPALTGVPTAPTAAAGDSSTQVATTAFVQNALPLIIAGNSGAANQNAAPARTIQVLTANSSTNNTTNIAVAMTTLSLAAGTYKYRYDIICQSDTSGNSIKFAVDATGTVTRHLYRLYFPSGGVTASTGAMDQEVNATTGNVYAFASTRVDNTTLGPFTDVDTTNADIHVVIEGMLLTTTVSGLTLGFASETTGITKLIAGTCLELVRLG